MSSLPLLRMYSPRNKTSWVVVEAIDFAKKPSCFFAYLLSVGEEMSRTEIQKTWEKERNHKPVFVSA